MPEATCDDCSSSPLLPSPHSAVTPCMRAAVCGRGRGCLCRRCFVAPPSPVPSPARPRPPNGGGGGGGCDERPRRCSTCRCAASSSRVALKRSHISFNAILVDGLRAAGAPRSSLLELEALGAAACKREAHWYNMPDNYERATSRVLDAQRKALKSLGDDATWAREIEGLDAPGRCASRSCKLSEPFTLSAGERRRLSSQGEGGLAAWHRSLHSWVDGGMGMEGWQRLKHMTQGKQFKNNLRLNGYS